MIKIPSEVKNLALTLLRSREATCWHQGHLCQDLEQTACSQTGLRSARISRGESLCPLGVCVRRQNYV